MPENVKLTLCLIGVFDSGTLPIPTKVPSALYV